MVSAYGRSRSDAGLIHQADPACRQTSLCGRSGVRMVRDSTALVQCQQCRRALERLAASREAVRG